MLKTLNNNEIETFVMSLDLVNAVADKYEGEASIPAGVEGLAEGLRSYAKNDRGREHKISTYVSWFIKTWIEASLGIESTDSPDK